MKLISVIIPVYNTEEFLPECLDSCMNQDAPDAEFICVNDGSPDGSQAILEDYAARDSRFKVITKPNGGLSSARNAGIRAASGKWLMFLDSDDTLTTDAFRQMQLLDERYPDFDIIAFWADTFPEKTEDEKWYRKTLHFAPAKYTGFTAKVLFGERGAMPFAWRQAFSRSLLERTGMLFDESSGFGEDAVFQMCLFPQAEKFAFADSTLYNYRLGRSGSLMADARENAAGLADKHIDVISRVASVWGENGWTWQYGADFLNWVLKYVLLKIKALEGSARRERAEKLFDLIIVPYGLERFRKSLGLTGQMMWLLINSYRR